MTSAAGDRKHRAFGWSVDWLTWLTGSLVDLVDMVDWLTG